MQMQNDITYFAQTVFRNHQRIFGIRQDDRLMHTYVIGKTGVGKSNLLKTMLTQDITNGRGVCLLDPHGDLVQSVLDAVPKERKDDVIYFNIPDVSLTFKYNPFKKVSYEKRSLVASAILDVFKKLWADAWGVKLEHILRYCVLTLLDQKEATIADIPKLLLNKSFRIESLAAIKNDNVKAFWLKEFPHYNRYDLLPVLNKVGGMLAHPVLKRVLIENKDEISLRKVMDQKKIL